MPDIVVATPGRIIDHVRNSLSVGLEDLAVVILDEADRLLELGFSAEIQELVTVELLCCQFPVVLHFYGNIHETNTGVDTIESQFFVVLFELHIFTSHFPNNLTDSHVSEKEADYAFLCYDDRRN